VKANFKLTLFILFTLGVLVSLVLVGCAKSGLPQSSEVDTGGLDIDRDGVPDDEEVRLGLNPKNPDTDGDGLKDGVELDMGLNPKSPDTDGDGVSDADDFLPKFNNNYFYAYIGILVVGVTVAVISSIHIKRGLTKKRKDRIIETRQRREEEERLFLSVRDKILDMARERYGWLSLEEAASELKIDSKFLERYLPRLNAKRKGQLYWFPGIEKEFIK